MHMGSATMKHVNIMFLATIVFASLMATSTAATSSMDLSTAILVQLINLAKEILRRYRMPLILCRLITRKLFSSELSQEHTEKIAVPADKPFITISGTKASSTIITWSDGGEIFESATFTVLADDFVGRFLTIENTYGSAGKAVALRVSADRAAFYGCRILFYQDTLLDDTGNHYYCNCYIEGATDFICGDAASLFESCHIHSLSTGNGAITAQKRVLPEENTGINFLGCKITGVGKAVLGRPWGTYSRVVYALTYMSGVIQPPGWDDWHDYSKQRYDIAIDINTRGPSHVMNFVKKCKKLKVFVHVSTGKYPTLARIARNILALPITTVASESSFSTGARVVSPHRNKLHPSTWEALMCCQSLKSEAISQFATFLEEEQDEQDEHEEMEILSSNSDGDGDIRKISGMGMGRLVPSPPLPIAIPMEKPFSMGDTIARELNFNNSKTEPKLDVEKEIELAVKSKQALENDEDVRKKMKELGLERKHVAGDDVERAINGVA
ncbi:putative pectinesterase 11 [Citrus sinensis]|nr:putative pectinesterase 11 [Citrus sinensis]